MTCPRYVSVLAVALAVLLTTRQAPSHSVTALVPDERLPPHNTAPYILEAQERPSLPLKYESAALANVQPGVCYSPFHNREYPLLGGSAEGLDRAMLADFAVMSNYFGVVRTYYSSFFSIPVTPAAAAHDVQLFLGVFMTNEGWYENQVNDAIAAVRDHPKTVAAILVGNENVPPVGPFAPQEVTSRIRSLRDRVQAETGRTVPIGTVQRAAEWLDPSRKQEMQAMAEACDIIGVNIYPFFDDGYDAAYPLVILNAVWDLLTAQYPPEKLRLTEIGFPTAGAAPSYAQRNVPSLENARTFYDAFVNWNPAQGGHEAFWFMFFDRAPEDNTMLVELEKHFGFFTYQRGSKAGDFPARRSAIAQATAQITATVAVSMTPTPTTTTPTPTSTPSPTTIGPTTPGASTEMPTTPAPMPTVSIPLTTIPPIGAPAVDVCRVRKIFPGL